jgi:hypothetical protein
MEVHIVAGWICEELRDDRNVSVVGSEVDQALARVKGESVRGTQAGVDLDRTIDPGYSFVNMQANHCHTARKSELGEEIDRSVGDVPVVVACDIKG